MRKAIALTMLIAILGLPSLAMAQEDSGSSGGAVYERDEEALKRAQALSARAKSAGDETLADRTLTYNPDGRRDPFRPLVGGVATDEEQRGRLPGIAGLLYGEVQLVGIVEGGSGEPIAIFFGGPDEEGYFVREGMNFYNGSVYDINPVTKRVVIRQRVEDAIIPYKEIDIFLYPDEAEGR